MKKILILTFLLFAGTAEASSGINIFTNGIDVTPDTANAWVDVNVSSYVPAGATGAITLSTGSSSRRATLRENGSTDTNNPLRSVIPQTGLVGLDANGIFEAYMNNIAADKLYLIGYTSDGTDFLANRTNITPSAKNSWSDVTFSAVPDGATGVMLEFVAAGGSAASVGGVRANNSVDLFTGSGNYERNWYLVAGLDANKVAEVYASGGANPAITVYLVGWFMSPVSFETNAVGYPLSSAGSWQDMNVSGAPNGAEGAIWLINNTDAVNSRPGGARTNNSSNENYGIIPANGAGLFFSGLDGNKIAEGKIGNAAVDHYAVGYGVSTIDTTAPARSNGSPSGALNSGTTQTTISLNTNELAICKYSAAAGTAYDLMIDTFTATGGTSHSTTVYGLTDGNSYSYYVKCADVLNNKNNDDYAISFSVALPVSDTTPPVRSNGYPTGTLASGTTNANISLATDEPAACRYSTAAGTAYDSMTNTFSTTGGILHSTNVSGLTDGSAYSYYVRCQDGVGNQNDSDFTVNFSVASVVSEATFGLSSGNGTDSENYNVVNAMRFQNTAGDGTLTKIEALFDDLTPAGSVAMAVYADNANNVGSLLLNAGTAAVANGWVAIPGLNLPVTSNTWYWLAINLSATNNLRFQTGQPVGSHRWDGGVAYSALNDPFESNGNNATQVVMRATVSAATLDTTPPFRSNGSPSGTLASGTTQTNLVLNTNENAACRYSTSTGASYSAMLNTFTTTGGSSHSTNVAGLTDGSAYNYYVKCLDQAGNSNTDDYAITFSVASLTGNNYYVATTGSDGPSGGTETNPWRTIQYGLARLVSGDTLIIREGTYAENISTAVSGTSQSPISVRAYGSSGNYENVIIQGSLTVNQDYYDISHLKFTGSSSSGILITNTAEHIAIHDSEVYGNSGDGIYISSEGATPSNGPNFITIGPNNLIYNNSLDGIFAYPNVISGTYFHNIIITGNNIYGNLEGIDMRKCMGCEISNNIIRENNGKGIGCDLSNNTDDLYAKIFRNTIWDNHSYQVQMRTNCRGVEIYENYVYETYPHFGYGIIISHAAYNNKVYRNIVRNAGKTGAIAGVDNVDGSIFANNIVDGTQGGYGLYMGNPAAGNNITVVNNIVMNTPAAYYEAGLTNSTVDYNLYFNNGGTPDNGPNTLVVNPNLNLIDPKPDPYYRLLSGSPAIDSGIIVVGITDGFRGLAPDRGVYEYEQP